MAELQADGVVRIEDGNHGEYRPRRDEFSPDGTAFIRAANIVDGAVDFTGADRINEVALARIRKGIGKPNDVLLTHKGTVGRVARVSPYAPPFVCSPQTTFWRVLDENRLDRGYLFAYLRSPPFAQQMYSRMHGSDMAPYLSLTEQKSLLLDLPPIDQQRAIGWMLGSLDDKIENNRRLAETLEEIAATLFRARFVDFTAVEEFEESEIGSIPRGWKIGTLGDVAELHRDLVSAEESDPDEPYIGLDRMPEGSTVLWTWGRRGSVSGQTSRFTAGDILFGKLRPYFRKVGPAPVDGSCSTEILVLRPKNPSHYATVLGHVSSRAFIDYCVARSTGTRMPRAEWRNTSDFPLAIPPQREAADISRTFKLIYELIRVVIEESKTLSSLRDALLPKLVSGEIRVPEGSGPEDLVEAA